MTRALIIDSDAAAADALAAVLTAGGFETVCMSSYDDALDRVLTEGPAIVFAPAFCGNSDIAIFLSKIRSFEDPDRARTPIVCVSAVPMEHFFDCACELDIFGYIEKPPSAPEVYIVARKAAFYLTGGA